MRGGYPGQGGRGPRRRGEALLLLTYNVNGLESGPDRVARVIRSCAADVVCIQESPRLVRWHSRCARLARLSGLNVLGGGFPAGLLVLGSARTQVVHLESRWLSPVPRYLQRGLTLAVVDVEGVRVVVANMHLDLYPAGRIRHIREILARLEKMRRRYGGHAVLAGDVNEEPGGPVWQVLTERFRDAYAVAPSGGASTLPAVRPRARIDGVFAGPELSVRSCGVPDVPGIADASDHRPVLAECSTRKG